MGSKAKKAMKKTLKKASTQSSLAITKIEAADFLPLEGGPARNLSKEKLPENNSTVLYLGRIPHGFYENEMEGFFGQFGTVKRLRIARNKKTGKSKHFGFIEFEYPEVASIVTEYMNNELLFEHKLVVNIIPPDQVHPKLWRGFNYKLKPIDGLKIQRKEHDKERTLEEHRKVVEEIIKRDKKRQRKIEEAGIDYECPEILRSLQTVPKKIKFDEDED